jgi:2-C-methyl-D-erythritol 4-phosphate cytidylyltransferase
MNAVKAGKVSAIIVAAGQSQRMNGLDKMLAPLAGKPVLAWSIEALQKSKRVDSIVLVNNQKNLEPVRCLVLDQKWTKVAEVCLGGQRRQDSVAAGLRLLKDCRWVIVHDGARPLLTQDLIDRGLKAADETGAAVAGVPVTDTIKMADEELTVIETPPRGRLWAIQTPQVFRFDILDSAYQQMQEDVTDDASLVELSGQRVKLYMGSYDNIKITTPRDLALAEFLIREHGK